jgi:hypothetical protein
LCVAVPRRGEPPHTTKKLHRNVKLFLFKTVLFFFSK